MNLNYRADVDRLLASMQVSGKKFTEQELRHLLRYTSCADVRQYLLEQVKQRKLAIRPKGNVDPYEPSFQWVNIISTPMK